jgi:hypothetical protein
LQTKPHAVPLQLAFPFAGTGQAVHKDPHELVEAELTQLPLQSCVPAGHPASPPASELPPTHDPPWHVVPAAHAAWLCQVPVPSQIWGVVVPEHRTEFGVHDPVHDPEPLQRNGHVCVVCQVPVESHVCEVAP